MHRGLLSTAVTALLVFAICAPTLAQETQGATEDCTDSGPTPYQYDCGEPRSPDCAPQQQYDDETDSCIVVDQYQYGDCDDDASSCATAQDQNIQAEDSMALPPASVQNVVVAVADSVGEDAPEASRALDAAEPVETNDNVALADEGETSDNVALADEAKTVAEAPARASQAPEEVAATGGTAPPPAAAPDTVPPPVAAPHTAPPPAEPVETDGDVALADGGEAVAEAPAYPSEAPEEAVVGGAAPPPVAAPDTAPPAVEPTEATEAAEAVVIREKREPEEVEGGEDPVAPDRNPPLDQVADRDVTFDQVAVPLFALAGSTLLIGGGLLVRRIVG